MKRKEKEEEEERKGRKRLGTRRTKPHTPWFQWSQATKLFFHPTPPPCVGRHGVFFSHSVVSVFPSRELSLHSHPASTRLEKVMKGRASQHCWCQPDPGRSWMPISTQQQWDWLKRCSAGLSSSVLHFPDPGVSRAQYGAEPASLSASIKQEKMVGGQTSWHSTYLLYTPNVTRVRWGTELLAQLCRSKAVTLNINTCLTLILHINSSCLKTKQNRKVDFRVS